MSADTAAPVEPLVYSYPDAAILLGLSFWGIRALVRAGQLRSITVGAHDGRRVITKADLDAYLAGRIAAAGEPGDTAAPDPQIQG